MESKAAHEPRSFLEAEWRKLVMAQYCVDPDVLVPWLPSGVELDFFDARVADRAKKDRRCYVSLVGFLFDRVRVKGVGVPLHRCFEEINLRFYVARTERDGTRKRGVIFVREFVRRAAISLTARWLYEEPYETLPTRRSIRLDADALRVCYEWRHKGQWQRLAVDAEPNPQPIAEGSEEEFVTEHYWGYTKRSRGRTSEYRVEHPRWKVYPVRNFEVKADFGAMYGEAFAALNGQRPASVLLAEGSEVTVYGGKRLGAGD